MTSLPNRTSDTRVVRRPRSRDIVVRASIDLVLALAHSLYTRGLERTVLFFTLSGGLAVLGEALAVHVLSVVRHHTRPQLYGLPLGAILGWVNIGYGTFAVNEYLLQAKQWTRRRYWLLP